MSAQESIRFDEAAQVEAAKEVIYRHLRATGCEAREGSQPYGTAHSATTYIKAEIGADERERFGVMFLDTRHRLIAWEVLFSGSVDRAMVYPREVIKRALALNASAILLAHNHPSGVPEPSASDIQLTSRLAGVCTELDIRLVDHIVVAGTRHVSFAERGLL